MITAEQLQQISEDIENGGVLMKQLSYAIRCEDGDWVAMYCCEMKHSRAISTLLMHLPNDVVFKFIWRLAGNGH